MELIINYETMWNLSQNSPNLSDNAEILWKGVENINCQSMKLDLGEIFVGKLYKLVCYVYVAPVEQ